MRQRSCIAGLGLLASFLLGTRIVAQCPFDSAWPSDGQANDRFAFNTAIDGDTLFVGAVSDDDHGSQTGAVYVFYREGHGTAEAMDDAWLEAIKLTAADGQADAAYGAEIALQGDLAVIAATNHDAGATDAGKVYFYVRDDPGTPADRFDDVWRETFSLVPPQPSTRLEFGVSLGLWGNTLAIGTEDEKVWIYERDDAGTPGDPFDDVWTQVDFLQRAAGRFGWSLSMHESTLLVGARRAIAAGVFEAGMSFVFDRDDAGTPGDPFDDAWIETAQLTADVPLVSGRFGRDVALADDSAMIGAWLSDATGLAYVFERDRMGTPGDPTDDVWIQTARLKPSDGVPGDVFGINLTFDGMLGIVGASRHDLGTLTDAGAAYVFVRDDNGTPGNPFDDLWPETSKLTAPRPAAQDKFGVFPHHQGTTAILGAPAVTNSGLSNSPGFFVAFDLDCEGLLLHFETEDDFLSTLHNGQDISGAEEFGRLLDIDGLAASGNAAAIFDSSPVGPNAAMGHDPDLLVDRGNVLMLQQSSFQSLPGFYDIPDDDRFGGELVFAFGSRGVAPLSVDLIDIDLLPDQDATVRLSDASGRTRTYAVPPGWTEDVDFDGPPGFRILSLQTLDDQPGFLATASASEDPGFDPAHVVRMTVEFDGSAALDNLRFEIRDERLFAPQLTGKTPKQRP